MLQLLSLLSHHLKPLENLNMHLRKWFIRALTSINSTYECLSTSSPHVFYQNWKHYAYSNCVPIPNIVKFRTIYLVWQLDHFEHIDCLWREYRTSTPFSTMIFITILNQLIINHHQLSLGLVTVVGLVMEAYRSAVARKKNDILIAKLKIGKRISTFICNQA